MCIGWVVGTFALHCWVLSALGGMPRWEIAKTNMKRETEALNSMVAGFDVPVEKRAQERAEMQMRKDKLAHALQAEENVQQYFAAVAADADRAGHQVVKRVWISWAIIAFVPVSLFAFASVRKKTLDQKPAT